MTRRDLRASLLLGLCCLLLYNANGRSISAGDTYPARYLPFAIWLRPEHVSAQALGSVAVLAVVCTAGAFMVMFALIAEAGPARMTLITYVNPAVAVLLGALVLDEPITLGLILGFPLIILGSILGTWRSATPAEDPLHPVQPIAERT